MMQEDVAARLVDPPRLRQVRRASRTGPDAAVVDSVHGCMPRASKGRLAHKSQAYARPQAGSSCSHLLALWQLMQ